MNSVLRLYPRAWRERYGDELTALLEERPASPLDQLDLIRGALDARLHPQVAGAATPPEQEIPMHQRQLGVVAAIGGIAWILAVASLFVLPVDPSGHSIWDQDSWTYPALSLAAIGLCLGIAMTGVALGELGTRRGSPASARTGHVLAFVSVGFGGLMLLPYPYFFLGFGGFMVLGIIAVVRGAMNGAFPGWFVVFFAVSVVVSNFSITGLAVAGPLPLILVGPAALLLAWLAFTRGRTDTPEIDPA